MGLSSAERAALVSESLSIGADIAKAAAGGMSLAEAIALVPKVLWFLGRVIRDIKD